MKNELIYNSMTFSLGQYQISCSIQDSTLKLRASAGSIPNHQLTLTRLNCQDSYLELDINSSPAHKTFEECNQKTHHRPNHQSDFEDGMQERILKLESYITKLQQQLEANKAPKKDMKLSSYWASKGNLREREQLLLPSAIIRQREASEMTGIIQKESDQNMKLELLNDILQQKLLKREGDLIELERSLMEREDLIRELAEKLITANMQKEDIFNEYEKILQSTVFHQNEQQQKKPETEPKPKPEAETKVEAINPPQVVLVQTELQSHEDDPIPKKQTSENIVVEHEIQE